jgi:hypothetical protein
MIMSIEPRTRLLVILGFAALTVLVVTLLYLNRLTVIHESAGPDQFALGEVVTGSKLELSARLLTSANKHPIDVLFEKAVTNAPISWQPTLRKWNPGRFRRKAPQMDLSTLKPKMELPGFVHLDKIVPDQRKDWYDNRPFFVVYLTIDTPRPASYTGRVKLRLDDREASLPMDLTIISPSARTFRLLITETPFVAESTPSGLDFVSAAKVLTALKVQLDCLRELPPQLKDYQTILLAEGTLVSLKDEELARLVAFVRGGGRLVIAANAFFVGTVAKANQIIADCGLTILDKDYTPTVTVTNIVPDSLTKDIHRLEFFRPSLIRVTDSSKAKILAPAPTLDGGFVAVARLPTGGEIIVFTQSLWWNRLETKNGSDNIRLLRNLLRPEPGDQ